MGQLTLTRDSRYSAASLTMILASTPECLPILTYILIVELAKYRSDMSYFAKLSTGTHPETGSLTRSWVYEEVSVAEVDLWRRHQALLDPERSTKHEATVDDLSTDAFHDQLRTHMRVYSKPPMLIHTDTARTSISPPVIKAWIQPTGEQLRGLDVSKPDLEGWLDLERVQGAGRSTSVRASDSSPINTTLTFTCPGLLLHHAAQG